METTRKPTRTRELLTLIAVGAAALTAVFASEICVWIAENGPVFWEALK